MNVSRSNWYIGLSLGLLVSAYPIARAFADCSDECHEFTYVVWPTYCDAFETKDAHNNWVPTQIAFVGIMTPSPKGGTQDNWQEARIQRYRGADASVVCSNLCNVWPSDAALNDPYAFTPTTIEPFSSNPPLDCKPDEET